MRTKRVTNIADEDLENVTAYIAQYNIEAAERFYRSALGHFFELPDNLLPKRADEELPEYVREIFVPSFKGYTLRIAIFESETYLLNAFAPGLADFQKNNATTEALNEIDSE